MIEILRNGYEYIVDKIRGCETTSAVLHILGIWVWIFRTYKHRNEDKEKMLADSMG